MPDPINFKEGGARTMAEFFREDTRHFIYTDKMEFHVIELPKLPQGLWEGCSDIELWARFINAERKEEFDMIAQRDPYIGSAYQTLQAISQDGEKRMEYEAREKAIRDYNARMFEPEERGRKEEAIRIAKKLVGMGYPTDDIVKITLLPEAEIERLSKDN